jgi:hypothetical protein
MKPKLYVLIGLAVALLALSASATVLANRSATPTTAAVPGVLVPQPSAPTAAGPPQDMTVVFLHHSVGANLIGEGDLRGLLSEYGYRFYDQGYNQDGLHLPDGSRAPYGYDVPEDNTDPDGLAAIFSQPVTLDGVANTGAPVNTLSGLLRHDVIVFKSCYPVSFIRSDEELARYKSYYLKIRDTVDRYPEHAFIALTPPPLEPIGTSPAAAARARSFANWLKSPEFVSGHPNLYVFDLFDLLAEGDRGRSDANMLREAYRSPMPEGLSNRAARATQPAITFLGVGGRLGRLGIWDESHPNTAANQAVAPVLAAAIDQVAQTVQMANRSLHT